MDIERLQKAATAAGYAMAAFEDEAADDVPAPANVLVPGMALMLEPPASRPTLAARDAVSTGSAWLKSLLPAIGGRAPA